MKKFGYVQNNTDHTLFLKMKNGKLTGPIIYVADMIMTGDDIIEMKNLKAYLASKIKMKDLCGLQYILGIEVTQFGQGIFLSQ